MVVAAEGMKLIITTRNWQNPARNTFSKSWLSSLKMKLIGSCMPMPDILEWTNNG